MIGVRLYEDVSPTMRAAWGTGGGNVPMILDDEIYSMANCDHTLTLYGKNVAPTLTSRMGTGGNQVPVFVENKANTLRANAGAIKHMADLKGRTVVENTAYSFDSLASNSMKSKNPNSGCREVGVSKTVDTSDPNPSKNQGGIGIVTKSYAVAQNQRGECRTDEKKSYALTATDGSRPGQSKPCVVDSYCIAGNTIDRKVENGGNGAGFQKDISYTLNTIDRHAVTDNYSMTTGNNMVVRKNSTSTLMARDCTDPQCVSVDVEPQISGTLAAADSKGKNGQDINKFPVVESRIRRLTPLECERLQGLPDGWTDVPSIDKKGNIKPASDSSRYKAIGNGMAQPCADFIIRRIVECSR